MLCGTIVTLKISRDLFPYLYPVEIFAALRAAHVLSCPVEISAALRAATCPGLVGSNFSRASRGNVSWLGSVAFRIQRGGVRTVTVTSVSVADALRASIHCPKPD